MFEKEAEEIAKDIYIHHFDDDVNYPEVLKAITVGVQKGAESREKENARLKLGLEALDGQIPWKDIKDKSEVIGQLTKAKELLEKVCEGYASVNISEKEMCDRVAEAEAFLKE